MARDPGLFTTDKRLFERTIYKAGNDFYMKAAAPPKRAPNTVTNKIIPISEITSPAIANPLGSLKIPTNDKINPSNQSIQPKIGTQPKNIAIRARTKPAVPTPFDLLSV